MINKRCLEAKCLCKIAEVVCCQFANPPFAIKNESLLITDFTENLLCGFSFEKLCCTKWSEVSYEICQIFRV